MICFHHNDMDGMCAGRVVAEYYHNFNPEDFISCDYSPIDVSHIDPDELVLFVDYSFTENTKSTLDDLIQNGNQIIWIDHHDSSIKLCNKYSYLDKIYGIRSKQASGAALAFMYFYKTTFRHIPKFIQYVSDYDNWDHNMYPESTWFKYAADSQDIDLFSPMWSALFDSIGKYDNGMLERMLDVGDSIFNYVTQCNETDLSSYGYEARLGDNLIYALNKRGNSTMFGDIINKYPFVVSWIFDGSNYKYSIYSTDSGVDCSKIAEEYGGGGHAGAAGFVSSQLILEPVS